MGDWFVETISSLQILSDLSGYGLVVEEGIAWYLVHSDESSSGDEPDCNHAR